MEAKMCPLGAEALKERLLRAWQGRVSGCQLGKPLEVLSMKEGTEAVESYLRKAEAWPLRDYVPLVSGSAVEPYSASCKEKICRSEPDDDINYTVLALLMLEKHGLELSTIDVARHWLLNLPIASTWTAERAALAILITEMNDTFAQGDAPGFDLRRCSENVYSEWIGAQIRADLYGWVLPGRSRVAAQLARQDAQLSHRGEGVYGAQFVAALGSAIHPGESISRAVRLALAEIPSSSACAHAIELGLNSALQGKGLGKIRLELGHYPVVHTVNNLAVVVWALASFPNDFAAAIGEAAAAGWDTDCNAATVGGLWGLQGKPIPELFTAPWAGKIMTDLSGQGEFRLEDIVERSFRLSRGLLEKAVQFDLPQKE
ncbi:MAG: ADP-ribosylglycohydrolase family protein [Polyangiaceae bacterium]|nr:ADP-ribosylglycohydrolase family protein [Polyangiaceae bacterium]